MRIATCAFWVAACLAGCGGSSYTVDASEPLDQGTTFADAGHSRDAGSHTTTGPTGDTHGTISVGGATRTYLLHVPASVGTAHGVSLVLVFHGLMTTGDQMAQITDFSPLADSEGFVVVYPDGLDRQWSNPGSSTDDVGFISALIDELLSSYDIDPTRVFATGASLGGMFTYRLAVELSDKISAAAVVAGFMPGYGASMPTPARLIPIQHFHGTDDTTVPYDHGVSGFDQWLTLEGCSTTPLQTNLPDTDPSDGTTVTRNVYGGCVGGFSDELYTINGGGHTWPGSSSHALPGHVTHDISATQVIWAYFQANHAL